MTGLEDLGVDVLPADMEIDLRHVMNLESPSIASRLLDMDEMDDLDDDLLEPFGLSPDTSQMAQLFQSSNSESRFFPMPDDMDMRNAIEPFILLPDRLSLNRDGLDDFEDLEAASDK